LRNPVARAEKIGIMKLTFSAVDNPEIPILLQVFANAKITVNEVVGRAQLVCIWLIDAA
jgi:hypothetical protein